MSARQSSAVSVPLVLLLAVSFLLSLITIFITLQLAGAVQLRSSVQLMFCQSSILSTPQHDSLYCILSHSVSVKLSPWYLVMLAFIDSAADEDEGKYDSKKYYLYASEDHPRNSKQYRQLTLLGSCSRTGSTENKRDPNSIA